MNCAAYTVRGTQCNRPGYLVREVDGKAYMLCRQHHNQTNVRVNTKMARGEEKPVDTSQINLLAPGTIAAAFEQLAAVGLPSEGIRVDVKKDRNSVPDVYCYKCNAFPFDTDEELAEHDKEVHSMIRIMVTGHTQISNEGLLMERLTLIMQDYINRFGKERIIAVSGGALGADRLWALTAYKLDVPFEIYVPSGYEDVFIALERYNPKPEEGRQKDLARFSRMLELASGVFDEFGNPREDGRYQRTANFKRNATMVRVSQYCVAVSKEDPRIVITHTKSGGTFHAIREWKKAGNTRINWVEVPQCNVHLNLEV